MSQISELFQEISVKQKKHHANQGVILSFNEFLEQFAENSERLCRNSAAYIKDMFEYFGKRDAKNNSLIGHRYRLFDLGTEDGNPIIGGEDIQSNIFNTLTYFTRQGLASKLIVLNGPNGSSKSSTVDAIANAMQKYSHCPEGAVYTFNWIFPTDKFATPTAAGESGPIGFGKDSVYGEGEEISYAHTDESKISSKIISEYKENPLFLIPLPYREEIIRQCLNLESDEIEIPKHLLRNGLSKKNQQIFENLLNAYHGDMKKVFRHIQVERFYFSKQYRVGISTIEPQISVDAKEQQLTMDKNLQNIPSVLQTISFFQARGELIEANRGLLEFSDFLKRPLESFKYLLTTIEKSSINLPSSSPNLDITFIATTNEKHLDAFKQVPDFSSFKARMELITVPYLLEVAEEQKIYRKDVDELLKIISIAPHAIDVLCTWAVMTRLKQPDMEKYPKEKRAMISKLDPYIKTKLYDNQQLPDFLDKKTQSFFLANRSKIYNESKGLVVYEGKFGASPREIRGILHKAAQNSRNSVLSVLDIFSELKEITKDKTLYEFLQFEPRAGYHDVTGFIKILEKEYAKVFESELLESMAMVDSTEYEKLLKRYIDHAVAQIKNEKILDQATGQYIPCSEGVLKEVEKILTITGSSDEYRRNLLSRIAAWKIDNPHKELIITELFEDLLTKIKTHFFKEKEMRITSIRESMLKIQSEEENELTEDQKVSAMTTFKNLESKGYDKRTAFETLKFLIRMKDEK